MVGEQSDEQGVCGHTYLINELRTRPDLKEKGCGVDSSLGYLVWVL